MEETIINLIGTLAVKYPIILSALSVVGILRVVNKPIFSVLHILAEATESTRDNIFLEKAEKSKIYKALVYVIDMFGSVKVKK